jgi:hypothetical protein
MLVLDCSMGRLIGRGWNKHVSKRINKLEINTIRMKN